MKERTIAQAVTEFAFTGHKIAMVSGPRQCGKTTMSRMLLARRKTGVYRNWDEIAFRREWAKNPASVIPREGAGVPLVVLDELHKRRRWKRDLKGLYDTLKTPCDILVTGSARLNVYRKGSDSLLGRHYAFRLHPFSLRELHHTEALRPDDLLDALFTGGGRRAKSAGNDLAAMMKFGPFPEPLFGHDDRKANLWRRNREQLIIREDLRDISRLPELDRIEMLTSLLPERVSSLFSLSSLSRDLEASVPTIKRWVTYLKELYYLFEIKPYSKRIHRSLRREGKIYLWDYGGVMNEAARFENLVAQHLLKTCHYWTDTGEGDFGLCYLRDKEKHEIDFLIVRDGKPWLPVEVKLSDTDLSPHWARFVPMLACGRCLQIVHRPAWKLHKLGLAEILVAGAAESLPFFA